MNRSIEVLNKDGWSSAEITGAACPFSLLAAKKGEILLVAVESEKRLISREEVSSRIKWAMQFGAQAEEWIVLADEPIEKRLIHHVPSEVHRQVGDQIDSRKMREVEQRAASYGLSQLLMMENAGRSIADVVNRYMGGVREKRIVVVAGPGNNGGDGMAAARHLSILGATVTVILLGEVNQLRTHETRANWNILSHTTTVTLETVEAQHIRDEQMRRIIEAEAVVDAIFGTGIKGEVGEPYKSAIEAINVSRGTVFAVDVPSGLDPDTGLTTGATVKARVTISLHMTKPGLLKEQRFTGELWIGSIGVPSTLS